MKLLDLIKRPGYEDVAELVAQWTRVAKRQKGRENSVPLPNYYLVADDGFDFLGLFNAIAEFLEANELMEFDGERKVYSFYLKYSRPEDPKFEPFCMLYDAVEHELTKFGHPYGGILVIDITEWVELNATKDRKFLDFLAYMDEIDERTLFVFLDRSGPTGSTADAFSTLDMATRLERVTMSYRDPESGLAELESELKRFEYTLAEDFRPKIRETVDALLQAPGSAGVASVRQMAEDMAYNALKGEREVGNVLDAETSGEFLPDGEWIRVFQKKARGRKLSLIGEEE